MILYPLGNGFYQHPLRILPIGFQPPWKFTIFLNPLGNTCGLDLIVSNPFGIFKNIDPLWKFSSLLHPQKFQGGTPFRNLEFLTPLGKSRQQGGCILNGMAQNQISVVS